MCIKYLAGTLTSELETTAVTLDLSAARSMAVVMYAELVGCCDDPAEYES